MYNCKRTVKQRIIISFLIAILTIATLFAPLIMNNSIKASADETTTASTTSTSEFVSGFSTYYCNIKVGSIIKNGFDLFVDYSVFYNSEDCKKSILLVLSYFNSNNEYSFFYLYINHTYSESIGYKVGSSSNEYTPLYVFNPDYNKALNEYGGFGLYNITIPADSSTLLSENCTFTVLGIHYYDFSLSSTPEYLTELSDKLYFCKSDVENYLYEDIGIVYKRTAIEEGVLLYPGCLLEFSYEVFSSDIGGRFVMQSGRYLNSIYDSLCPTSIAIGVSYDYPGEENDIHTSGFVSPVGETVKLNYGKNSFITDVIFSTNQSSSEGPQHGYYYSFGFTTESVNNAAFDPCDGVLNDDMTRGYTSYVTLLEPIELPEALREDYLAGYDDGKAEGLAEGFEKGHEEGFNEGYISGSNDVRLEWLEQGYDNGYSDAKREAIDMYLQSDEYLEALEEAKAQGKSDCEATHSTNISTPSEGVSADNLSFSDGNSVDVTESSSPTGTIIAIIGFCILAFGALYGIVYFTGFKRKK